MTRTLDEYTVKALEVWSACIEICTAADIEVNDLLERICADYGATYGYDKDGDCIDDDPIYFSLFNLPKGGKRRFIREANKIINRYKDVYA